ncbi:MAG: DUF3131 domain-containing protein [Candidatus Caldarchaeum sp.]
MTQKHNRFEGRPASALGILLIVIAIVISTLSPVFSYQPKEENSEIEQWLRWARTAWGYFQPGVGVDPRTGIAKSAYWWPYVTDWDTGGYIIAIIQAELMGLIPAHGTWGAYDRIEKVLRFLEYRPLSPKGIPYLWYRSADGSNMGDDETNVSDAGRLLIALYLLKEYRPDLSSRIDFIVKRNNYEALAEDSSAWRTTSGFYMYYVAHGFKFFGFDVHKPVQRALDEFNRIANGPHVDVFGVSLPIAEVTSEPVLHTIFELSPDERYMDYARRIYMAQERRYKETGRYTAWSEGNTGITPSYVFQWVVHPAGAVWRITPQEISPIVFTKAAIGLHAVFKTEYTKSLVNYILSRISSQPSPGGFLEGVDENGRIVAQLIDKTQVLVISAAFYALMNLAQESERFILEVSDRKITLGETVRFNVSYSPSTFLKPRQQSLSILVYDKAGEVVLQRIEEGFSGRFTFEWVPESAGIYRVEAKSLTDYVLHTRQLSKNSSVAVWSAKITSVGFPLVVGAGNRFKLDCYIVFSFEDDEYTAVPLRIYAVDGGGKLWVELTRFVSKGTGTERITLDIISPKHPGNFNLQLKIEYLMDGVWRAGNDADISVQVVSAKLISVEYPKTVLSKSLFNIKATVEYYSNLDKLPLKVVVKDLEGRLLQESGQKILAGSGNSDFTIDLQAPDYIGNFTVEFEVQYRLGEEWVRDEIDGTRFRVAFSVVERDSAMQDGITTVKVVKETVTETVTVREVHTQHTTVTNVVTKTVIALGQQDSLTPMLIILTSVVILVATMLLFSRRYKLLYNYES